MLISAQGKLLGLRFGQDFHFVIVDDEGAVLDFDVAVVDAVSGIVFQQMSQRRRIGDVVHAAISMPGVHRRF